MQQNTHRGAWRWGTAKESQYMWKSMAGGWIFLLDGDPSLQAQLLSGGYSTCSSCNVVDHQNRHCRLSTKCGSRSLPDGFQ